MIHLFIIVLIFSACNVLHPVQILEIPFYRFTDSRLKVCLRLPANFFADFIRCDRISSVMPFSVFDILDQIFINMFSAWVSFRKYIIEQFQDCLHNLDISALIVSANVISLT